jgi:hypothetical protein
VIVAFTDHFGWMLGKCFDAETSPEVCGSLARMRDYLLAKMWRSRQSVGIAVRIAAWPNFSQILLAV